ncbi:type II toxin-antitoxin system VapC family toxin [Candidatus Woesearchaeota archaeon]|nr:type II toxin-antitoxin system VapC family toxin [Candidatus Woesearchaeota archaeon]
MSVYIDSNIFLYVALRNPDFFKSCEQLLLKVQQQEILAITSVVTLCEVHYEVQKQLGIEAANLTVQSILSLPMTVVALDLHILSSALHQVKEHRLQTMDAVHYATALAFTTDTFYSYDKDFNRIEIPRKEP